MTFSFFSWITTFLFASIPFGIFIGKIFIGKDIRTEGSGNIGATNVSRVAGFWPAGFLTFILDLSKGLLPVLVFRDQMQGFWNELGMFQEVSTLPSNSWILALIATVGHCFSPWLKFKGGKGVSTAFGALAIISPFAALAGLLGYGITFYIQKTSSLGSMIGLGIALASDLALYSRSSVEYLLFLGFLFIIVTRHEKNLLQLVEETEKSFDSVKDLNS